MKELLLCRLFFALTNRPGSLWLILVQESLVSDRLSCHCRNFRAADEAVICTPQVDSVELSDVLIITNRESLTWSACGV